MSSCEAKSWMDVCTYISNIFILHYTKIKANIHLDIDRYRRYKYSVLCVPCDACRLVGRTTKCAPLLTMAFNAFLISDESGLDASHYNLSHTERECLCSSIRMLIRARMQLAIWRSLMLKFISKILKTIFFWYVDREQQAGEK